MSQATLLLLRCVMVSLPMLVTLASFAESTSSASGGGRYDPPTDEIDSTQRAELLQSARAMRHQLGLDASQDLKNNSKGSFLAHQPKEFSSSVLSENSTLLRWPVRPGADNRSDFQTGISNYVDLNAAPGAVLDYACGARTYDRPSGYNHDGIDIASWPYPWTVMQDNGLEVVAAAEGVIVAKTGNQSDRSCTFDTDASWNVVVLAHDDGKQTVYGHLKRNSLTSKGIGERVVAGEYLGQVGSSGISTGPHLHFELLDENDNTLDPFAGACGGSASHWRWQPEYNRPGINAVVIGDAAPVIGGCDGSEQPGLASTFEPGQTVYVTSFFVNQPQGEAASLEVIAPDGSVWLDSRFGTPPEHFNFSFWYRSFNAPAIPGRWRVRVALGDEISEQGFAVSEPATDGVLLAAVLPGSRSVVLNQTATAFATIVNGGNVALEGCRVLPLGPIAGRFTFQATDPTTNSPIGTVNQPVSLPVGGAQSFILSLAGAIEVAPSNIEFNFKCNNAPRASSIRGLNTLQLSVAANPPADILPVSATAQGDGVVRLSGVEGAAAFSAAALNIGAAESEVLVMPVALGNEFTLRVCETDAAGACVNTPTAEIVTSFGGGARTFSVFVTGKGSEVSFDPELHRIELRFIVDGIVRGVTSVAVTTD